MSEKRPFTPEQASVIRVGLHLLSGSARIDPEISGTAIARVRDMIDPTPADLLLKPDEITAVRDAIPELVEQGALTARDAEIFTKELAAQELVAQTRGKTSRRKFLKHAGIVTAGAGALALSGRGIYHIVSDQDNPTAKQPQEQQTYVQSEPISPQTSESSQFDISFDLENEITDSDWDAVVATAEQQKEEAENGGHPYPGFLSFRATAIIVDPENAKKIRINNRDWQTAKSELIELEKNGYFHQYKLHATDMRIAFGNDKDKMEELDVSLNANFDNLMNDAYRDPGNPWNIPVAYFTAKVLYPGREAEIGIENHRNTALEYAQKIRDEARVNNDSWYILHFYLAYCKHIYPGFLSSFNEEETKLNLQETIKTSLQQNRFYGDWYRFLDEASFAKLLEAKNFQMTPKGLIVS